MQKYTVRNTSSGSAMVRVQANDEIRHYNLAAGEQREIEADSFHSVDAGVEIDPIDVNHAAENLGETDQNLAPAVTTWTVPETIPAGTLSEGSAVTMQAGGAIPTEVFDGSQSFEMSTAGGGDIAAAMHDLSVNPPAQPVATPQVVKAGGGMFTGAAAREAFGLAPQD